MYNGKLPLRSRMHYAAKPAQALYDTGRIGPSQTPPARPDSASWRTSPTWSAAKISAAIALEFKASRGKKSGSSGCDSGDSERFTLMYRYIKHFL